MIVMLSGSKLEALVFFLLHEMIHRSAKSLENATRDAFTYDALEIQPHYFRISVQASFNHVLLVNSQ